MEVFDQRGPAAEVRRGRDQPDGATSAACPSTSARSTSAHFGVDGIPQSRTEAVLEAWAVELGADIRRGHEVVGDRPGPPTASTSRSAAPTARARCAPPTWSAATAAAARSAGWPASTSPAPTRPVEMYLADVTDCEIAPAARSARRLPGGMVMAAPLGGRRHPVIVCERGAPPAAARPADLRGGRRRPGSGSPARTSRTADAGVGQLLHRRHPPGHRVPQGPGAAGRRRRPHPPARPAARA